MSDKALFVTDMPKCCDTCIFSSISSDNELFEDGECYCILKRKSVDDIKEGFKPDWCPLKPIPEKKIECEFKACSKKCCEHGWNACIDKILEGEE